MLGIVFVLALQLATASQCGVAEATIKMLGRWESSAYLLYIKTPRDHLASISALMSK